MSNKSTTQKSRFAQKHDVEANWDKAVNFVPLEGEMIIYDPDKNYDYPRIKVGDGKTWIGGLPFITKLIDELPIRAGEGINSFVQGQENIAEFDDQFVHGRYNEGGDYAHIIGGGTADGRKNIYTLDWEGNATFGGQKIQLGETVIEEYQLIRLLEWLETGAYPNGDLEEY